MNKKGISLRNIAAILIPIILIAGAGTVYLYQTQLETPNLGFFIEKPKIGVINLNGPIQGFEYANLAEEARKNDEIEAVVVRVNSPGGGVTGTFQAETSVSKLAEEKPVVASIEEIAASGAYIIASAADKIYAYEYSTTGGLGVRATWVSYEDYYEDQGIDYFIWKTGDQKDLFAPWRKPTEEENEYIQNLIEEFENELYTRIDQNRQEQDPKLEDNKIQEGYTVYGFEAINLKLVDELGTYQDALDFASKEAGLEEGEYEVVNISNITN